MSSWYCPSSTSVHRGFINHCLLYELHWYSTSRCMTSSTWSALFFLIATAYGNHNTFTEEKFAEKESWCTTPLVSTSSWPCPLTSLENQPHQIRAIEAPFKGRHIPQEGQELCFSQTQRSSDGDLQEQRSLEVLELWTIPKKNSTLLQHVWSLLEPRGGAELCPAWNRKFMEFGKTRSMGLWYRLGSVVPSRSTTKNSERQASQTFELTRTSPRMARWERRQARKQKRQGQRQTTWQRKGRKAGRPCASEHRARMEATTRNAHTEEGGTYSSWTHTGSSDPCQAGPCSQIEFSGRRLIAGNSTTGQRGRCGRCTTHRKTPAWSCEPNHNDQKENGRIGSSQSRLACRMEVFLSRSGDKVGKICQRLHGTRRIPLLTVQRSASGLGRSQSKLPSHKALTWNHQQRGKRCRYLGNLGRRRCRPRVGGTKQDQGEHRQHCSILELVEEDCRSTSSRLRAGSQKTKAGRKRILHQRKQGNAAFSQARLNGTEKFINLGPNDPRMQRWGYSHVWNWEFTKEPYIHCKHTSKDPNRKTVNFAQITDVLYLDDWTCLEHIRLPHDFLIQWTEKPWSKYPPLYDPRSDHQWQPLRPEEPPEGLDDDDRCIDFSQCCHPGKDAYPWIQDIWQHVFVPQAHRVGAFFPSAIELFTWYLDDEIHTRCDTYRILQLDEEWWNWTGLIKLLWRDRIKESYFDITLVRPEPPRRQGEVHQAHAIISQTHNGDIGTLVTAIVDHDRRQRQWQIAVNVPPVANKNDFLRLVPAYNGRHPDRYLVIYDDRTITDRLQRMSQGASIEVHCDPAHPWQDADESFFMATGPPQLLDRALPRAIIDNEEIAVQDQEPHQEEQDQPSDYEEERDSTVESTPEWYSSIVYSLSRPAATGRTVWTDHDYLHRSIADIISVSRHDLQSYYPVTRGPTDLHDHDTQVFLALLFWDAIPGEHLRLVLLDTEFYPQQTMQQPEVVREARLIPSQLTYQQLLQMLGLRNYCSRTTQQGCLFWINRELQKTQSQGFHYFNNRDYVRIALPPEPELEPDVPTRLAVAYCNTGHSFEDITIWKHLDGLDHNLQIEIPSRDAIRENREQADHHNLMQTNMHTPGETQPAKPTQQAFVYDQTQPWRNSLYIETRLCTAETEGHIDIATWFLDHDQLTYSEEARLVTIDGDYATWRSKIVDTWSDLIENKETINIDMVRPSPGGSDLLEVEEAVHIILTQYPDPIMASTLAKLTIDGTTSVCALVVPGLSFPENIFNKAGLLHRCPDWAEDLDCELTVHGIIRQVGRPMPVDTGDLLTIKATTVSKAAEREENTGEIQEIENDEISQLQNSLFQTFYGFGDTLMQRAYDNWLNVCRLEDIDIPNPVQDPQDRDEAQFLQTQTSSQHRSILGDITNTHQRCDAPFTTLPKRARRDEIHINTEGTHRSTSEKHNEIHDMPLFEQELHQLDLAKAQTQGRASSQLFVVHTWYIDHVRVPKQHWDKIVHLNRDFTTWRQQLLASWAEVALPHRPAYFHIVRPSPSNLFQGPEIHVIITQTPVDGLASILISTEFPRRAAGFNNKVAVALSRVTTEVEVQETADCGDLRLGRFECDRTYLGHNLLTPDRIYPVDDGDHFRITTRIQEGGVPVDRDEENISPTLPFTVENQEPEPEDGLSLLQTQSLKSQEQATQGILKQILQKTHDLTSSRIEDDPQELLNSYRSTAPSNQQEQQQQAWQQLPPELQELHEIYFHTRTERPNIQDGLTIFTWFLDHERSHRCTRPRRIELLEDFTHWYHDIISAWRDEIETGEPVELHIVRPTPYTIEQNNIAHILVCQRPSHRSAGTLITTVRFSGQSNTASTIAQVLDQHNSHEQLLQAADTQQTCQTVDTTCTSWHGWTQLTHRQFFDAHNGMGLTILVSTQHGRQIADAVAHARQPADVVTLNLEELLCHTQEGQQETVVEILYCHTSTPHPNKITLPANYSDEQVRQELSAWGHKGELHKFGEYDKFLCVKGKASLWTSITHYMFVHNDPATRDGAFLHSQESKLNELEAMKLLHQLGFTKAVILHFQELRPDLHQIVYSESFGILETKPMRLRTQTAWPVQQNKTPWPHERPSQHISTENNRTETCLITASEHIPGLQTLLRSSLQLLHTLDDLHKHELPELVNQALDDCKQLSRIDRFVVYTDGTSHAKNKRATPDTGQDPNEKVDAWAFVVLAEQYADEEQEGGIDFVGWMAHPVLYRPEQPHWLGATRYGSDIAEKEALTWAGLWRLGMDCFTPTTFRPDSMLAANQATGVWGSCDTGLGYKSLRGVFQALEALLPQDALLLSHTRGHAGDPWNEFADFLAGKEAEKSYYCRRQDLDLRDWGPILPHLWTFLDWEAGLPQLHPEGFAATPPNLPKHKEEAHRELTTHKTQTFDMAISIATANVNSLHQGPEGHAGKTEYIRQQMISHHLNLLGLQETRTGQGMSAGGGVVRLTSGANKGHHGIELWVNTTQPYAWKGKTPLYLRRDDLQVQHADPRILLVRVTASHWKCCILVAHAPQSGRTREEREKWWHHLQDILDTHGLGEPLYAMLDANAATGPADGTTVFSKDDRSTANTPYLREFLVHNQLCLPATREDLHEGDDHTWTSPDGEIHCRIDYVAIPQTHIERCNHAQVVHTFDLGNKHDHTPAALDLRWRESFTMPERQNKNRTRRSIDRTQINKTSWQALSKLQIPDWETDIETHAASIQRQVLDTIENHSSPPITQAKKPYITEAIWETRKQKLQAKKAVKSCKQAYKRELLQQAFNAWRKPQAQQSQDFLHYAECKAIKCSAALSKNALLLRKQLCSAKRQALNEIVDTFDSTTAASTIIQQLKPLIGPTNPKKVKARPLPILRKDNGQPCRDTNEALEVWIEFFKKMEGGERLDEQQQRQKWLDNLASLQAMNFTVDITELPTLTDLEEAFRRVKSGKACGPDQVPPEICRHAATQLAKAHYTQLLKLCLHGQEPLEQKGGRLVSVWKGRGAQDKPESYRSLLISSHLGKCIHRTLRMHQSSIYEAFLQHQQIGGRKAVPVVLGCAMMRSFMRYQKTTQRNAGIILLDLQEAFYRLVRPLVIETELTDDKIAAMAHRLGLSDDALHELHRLMKEPCATLQASMKWHQRKAITAVHSDTFFQMAGQQDYVHTELGSRPGDAFADIVFGYGWGRLLRSLEQELLSRHIIDEINIFQDWHPFQDNPHITGTQPYVGPCWMDDLAICIQADTPSNLESKIGYTCGALIDLCHNHAMTPNLKPGKTEILMAVQGRGSRSIKKKYFGNGSKGTMPIMTQDGVQEIQVVSQYTHLGTVIHHSTNSLVEVRRRLAIGHQAFNQHRRLLFQNKTLSWTKRKELFNSLVISKVLYGSETWEADQKEVATRFHKGVMKLYRRLLQVKHDDQRTDEDILERGDLLSPQILLRRARLRFLATLYRCANVVPWELLHMDLQWKSLIRTDISWMYEQLSNSSDLPDPQVNFHPWLNILQNFSKYWKRLVSRATEHARLQTCNSFRTRQLHEDILSTLEHYGDLAVQRPPAPTTSPDGHYGCLRCGQRCRNKAGERVHMFRRHGILAHHRHFFDTTTCPCCLKDYHSITRVSNHLRHHAPCREALQGSGIRVTPVPAHGSLEDTHREQSTKGLRYPQQAAGPLLPPARRIQADTFHEGLHCRISELLLEGHAEDLAHHICIAAKDLCVPWSQFVETLKAYYEHYTDLDEQQCGIARASLAGYLSQATDPDFWPFLDDPIQDKENQILQLDEYEHWIQQL